MPGRRLLLLFISFIFCWPSFALAAPAGETDPGAREALRRGVELYHAGQQEEALSRLRGFILRYGGSPLLPEAYLYLARIFQEAGRPAEALLYLERIPAEKRLPEVQLLEGAARIGTGEVERGIELLMPLADANLREADRRLRFTALADGHAAAGRMLPALFFLQQGIGLPGSGTGAQEHLQQRAHLLLRDRLNDDELAEAAFMFAGTPLGEDARLQMALRAFSRGELARARQLAGEIVQSGIAFPYRQDAILLHDRLSSRDWVDRSVGVLLPLSGRFAPFGELVRRGMELALQVHSDSGARLFFVDTGADAEKSAQAVSTLANEQRVMAIAGPMTGAAAAAAAAKAQQEKVPLLTLSQRDGLAEVGEYVFRNSLTSRLQVRTLVRFAMEDRGITDFGILFPENRVGKEMAELFAREVIARQGRVIVQQSYAESDTDFRVQIRRLQGRDPHAPEDSPAGTAGQGASAPLFQALFIPDDAARVALVVPQLEFYGLKGVQLLGTSGWNSQELPRLAGSAIEDAVFVDGFFRYSPFPFIEEFVNLYFEKYGDEPTFLEAQGFDVASILLTQLADPALRSREDLRLALSQLENFPGVTGATSFNAQGDAEKILFLLQIQNGNIVQVN